MNHCQLLAAVLAFGPFLPIAMRAQEAEEKNPPDKILLKDFRPRVIY